MASRTALYVLGALVLGGCGGDDPVAVGPGTESDPTIPVDGDTLVVAIPFDPGSLDAARPPLGLSAAISELIQPGLVRRHMVRGELLFEPMLAASFEATAEGATYVLRDGLVWQDGAPVTAADAAFTWKHITDPATRSPFRGDARVVGSVEAQDDKTVVLRSIRATRPALLHGAATRGLVPHQAPDDDPPLASGSFRVEQWAKDDLLVLAANAAAAPALRPHLDRVVFDVMPSYEARLDGLLRGQVDLVTGIEVHDVARINATDGLELFRIPSSSVLYVGYDLKDPRFSDARVRRALTMTVDRERLIRDVYTKDGQSYGSYAIGTVSPALEGWFAREILPEPFDPSNARALLVQAGWGDSNRDGVADRGGRDLAFTLLVQGGSTSMDRTADLLVAWWGSIGVKVTIEHVEPTTMASRVAGHDFEAFLWSYPADPRVDPGVAWRTGGAQNWVGYSSKPVDKAIDDALAATDIAEAQRLVHDIQRMVYADSPVTFLVWQDQLAVIGSRFQGVDPDLFSLFHGIEGWYVPQAKQRWGEQTPDPRIPPAPVRSQ